MYKTVVILMPSHGKINGKKAAKIKEVPQVAIDIKEEKYFFMGK